MALSSACSFPSCVAQIKEYFHSCLNEKSVSGFEDVRREGRGRKKRRGKGDKQEKKEKENIKWGEIENIFQASYYLSLRDLGFDFDQGKRRQM